MPAKQPTPAPVQPRENTVLSEPATPQSCARDYAQAADVRNTAGKQWATTRR